MEDGNSTLTRSVTAVLTLALLLGVAAAMPAAAEYRGELDERTDTTYRLLPEDGVVHVDVATTLVNKSRISTRRKPCKDKPGMCKVRTRWYFNRWGHIWTPYDAVDVEIGGPNVAVLPAKDDDGFYGYPVKFPKLWNKKGTKQKVTASFDIPAARNATTAAPTRIENGYAYFCWWGMPGDTGTTKAVLPPGYETVSTGRVQPVVQEAPQSVILRAPSKKDPLDFWLCTEAFVPEILDQTFIIGADGQSLVVIEAWPDDEAWAADMADAVRMALPRLEEVLGTPMPYGELRIREVATESRPYVSGDLRPTNGVLGMCEDAAGQTFVPTRLARAWIDPEQVTDPWLAEGLTAWLGYRATDGGACTDPGEHPGPGAPDLDDWHESVSDQDMPFVEWQWGAACGIIEAGAQVIGDEAMYQVIRDLIAAPVPVDASHWIAAISRDLPDGLDTVMAALDEGGVDH